MKEDLKEHDTSAYSIGGYRTTKGGDKRVKSSLSSYTNQTNSLVHDTLDKLGSYYQSLKYSIMINGYSKQEDYNNVDASEMIQSTTKEIRSLNYRLKRIITTDDSHIILHPLRGTEVDVYEETYMYCKIPIKGCEPPAKFQISLKRN